MSLIEEDTDSFQRSPAINQASGTGSFLCPESQRACEPARCGFVPGWLSLPGLRHDLPQICQAFTRATDRIVSAQVFEREEALIINLT